MIILLSQHCLLVCNLLSLLRKLGLHSIYFAIYYPHVRLGQLVIHVLQKTLYQGAATRTADVGHKNSRCGAQEQQMRGTRTADAGHKNSRCGAQEQQMRGTRTADAGHTLSQEQRDAGHKNSRCGAHSFWGALGGMRGGVEAIYEVLLVLAQGQ